MPMTKRNDLIAFEALELMVMVMSSAYNFKKTKQLLLYSRRLFLTKRPIKTNLKLMEKIPFLLTIFDCTINFLPLCSKKLVRTLSFLEDENELPRCERFGTLQHLKLGNQLLSQGGQGKGIG